MRGLKDKVAIVTGAGSPNGIGFATAARLAEEGAKVVLTDINGDGAKAQAAALVAAGYPALGLSQDTTDEQGWEDVVSATKAAFGDIDILVNNVGISISAPGIDTRLEDWRRTLDVNAMSAFLGCRIALREMHARGTGGAIVNLSSVAALKAGETGTAYCASKGAIQMLTKVLAIENAKFGIRVNCVNPGLTQTDMVAGAPDDMDEMAGFTAAAGRMAKPSEIASAIVFLASDDASYCVGTSLVVDGGYTA